MPKEIKTIECYKCHGTGYILGFSHIANGRCFQCMGSGFLKESSKKNIGYKRQFLNIFYKGGGCWSLEELNSKDYFLVKWTSMQDHATAKQGLFENKKDGSFILGQPICRSSWYSIPKDNFAEFLSYYNDVYKLELLDYPSIPI